MKTTEIPLVKAWKDLKWIATDEKAASYDIFGTAFAGACYLFIFQLLLFPFYILWKVFQIFRKNYYEFKIYLILKH